MRIPISAMVLLALAAAAPAQAFTAGQYTLGIPNPQQICLQLGGTWYSPTVPGWGGQWLRAPRPGLSAVIAGNQSNGYFNDFIAVKRATADFTEWTDDGAGGVHFFGGIEFTFVKKQCDPPGSR